MTANRVPRLHRHVWLLCLTSCWGPACLSPPSFLRRRAAETLATAAVAASGGQAWGQDPLRQSPDIRSPKRSRPKPELGVKVTGLGLMQETVETRDGIRSIAVELLASSGRRVTVSFQSPWPLTSKNVAANGITVRPRAAGGADAGFGGADAFVQVLPGMGKNAPLTSVALLEGVLSPKGRFAVYDEPERVEVLDSKGKFAPFEGIEKQALDASASSQVSVMARFLVFSPTGADFQTRILISAIVVEDDAFLLVASAREKSWRDVEKQLRDLVGSFRAISSSAVQAP